MEAERLACWFNSLKLCLDRYPYLDKRLYVSLTQQHAEGKLWIKEKLYDLGMHFDNTIIICLSCEIFYIIVITFNWL